MKYSLPIFLVLVALFIMMVTPIIVKHIVAFIQDVVSTFKQPGIKTSGHRSFQGGFVTLLRPYSGYLQGQVVELPASTESSLIAAGMATTSAGPATAGALTCSQTQGAAAIAIGTSSVVITNNLVTPQSIIFAVVAQVAADATCLRVERIVAGVGLFTIYGTANATAATAVDWAIVNPSGVFASPT